MALQDEWKRFFENIETITNPILEERTHDLPPNQIQGLLAEVLKLLRDDKALRAVEKSAAQMLDTDEARIPDLMERELKLFNTAIEGDPSNPDPKKTNQRLQQAQTVKDSLGKLFKIPGWLQKILDILDELLSLLRP